MTITIPNLALVVLIGPSGSGKSTFARKHFKPTEVLSSDACRGLVCDDENEQAATKDAFAVLHYIAGKRLAGGRLTVIDATSIRPEDRKPLVSLAREYHCIPVAIVLDVPRDVCIERNRGRADRDFGPRVIVQQIAQMNRGLRGLKREGFSHVYRLRSCEEIEAVTIQREPLYSDLRCECGPFDIIGDLHGCADELEALLQQLGYVVVECRPGQALDSGPIYAHPDGRRAIFLGDLGDRGPRILDCFRIVSNMSAAGHALCVPGNHDMKLLRLLRGKEVQIKHGLAMTVAEIEALPADVASRFRTQLAEFIDDLTSHYVLDGGRLVVAHAGMKEEMQGRGSGKVREFALYGETTGETDEFGLPARYNWAGEYRGRAHVVYGHTPVPEPQWLNRTINIDTGCVFGGSLTALRWPERELVSVPAARVYFEPARPFLPASVATSEPLSAQHEHDDLLDLDEVSGKRIITTSLLSGVTIRGENAAAALEVMSRFAINPKWLIYLPPTMSPSETTTEPGLLEHPAEAFAYFRKQGVSRVICEEKHMGSRAVVIVCRDAEVGRERFGVAGGGIGACYTRTGRPFFNEPAVEAEFLERVRAAVERAGLWEELRTNWVCLDCELMPWSAKAQELLKTQYAAVGAAGLAAMDDGLAAINSAAGNGVPITELADRYRGRREQVQRFVGAYRRYCWTVESVANLRLAPFHILASEGAVHDEKDHGWHMAWADRLADAGEPLIQRTKTCIVGLGDSDSEAAGAAWWTGLTESGGEGIVIKPLTFIARGKKGPVQPALKCRGREYLRIIYGADYTADEHLARLRERSVSGKRSLALREFALGLEGLHRFIHREPLRRVHECVFGVLALESEPVDPRL